MEKYNLKAIWCFVFSLIGGILLSIVSIIMANDVERKPINGDYTKYYFAKTAKILSIIKLVAFVVYGFAMLIMGLAII